MAESRGYQKKLIIGIIVAAVVVWAGIPILVYISLESWDKRGQFGDVFGSVNALFSGIAFAGLIYAILLQKEELGLQREELTKTRAEFEQQNQTLRKQRFENTFFSLIGFHNDIIAALRINRGGENFHGRECFLFFYREFQEIYASLDRKTPAESEDKKIRAAQEIFFRNWHSYTGHYFRTLYNIAKFVKYSDSTDKQIYMNLLRAQLSADELALLFYNCLGNIGRRKFKDLVEEFALLENIGEGVLLKEVHKELYTSGAFQESSVTPSTGPGIR